MTFINKKKTHACVILTVLNVLLTVKMLTCSPPGTFNVRPTHQKRRPLYMTAGGAMKCVSMLCKLGCVHAFNCHLPFLKPQRGRQDADAAGLSIVFEGFAHLFGLVL